MNQGVWAGAGRTLIVTVSLLLAGANAPAAPAETGPAAAAVSFSTLLGAGVQADDMAVDPAGNIYLTGSAAGIEFPLTNAIYPRPKAFADVFVAKLDPTGSSVLFATYFGGSFDENGTGIALDGAGNVYVSGWTTSSDFPTTGPASTETTAHPFLLKLDPTGTTVLFSKTYGSLPGSHLPQALAVDEAGNAYVTGNTDVFGPLEVFVLRFAPDGDLSYRASLGGPGAGTDIALGPDGSLFVGGFTAKKHPEGLVTRNTFPATRGAFQRRLKGPSDGFVAKMNAASGDLLYATFLGGNGPDAVSAVEVDATGAAWVAGGTGSKKFPLRRPLQPKIGGGTDAFVAKLSPDGSDLVFSTFLGGSGNDSASAIGLDASGRVEVVGTTESADFPLRTPVQPAYGGEADLFAARLDPAASALLSSTYLGGRFFDFFEGAAVDAAGNLFVAVGTSDDFPSANPLNVPERPAGLLVLVKLSPE